MILNDKHYKLLLSLLIILQPIIELDYLFYNVLDNYNLPRLTTILRFIIIPIFIVYGFYKYDKSKKSIIISSTYLIMLLIYFIIHSGYAYNLVDKLYLTSNFYFSYVYEFIYIYTMVVPYYLIYLFYKVNVSNKFIEYVSVTTSLIISSSIVLSNIFVFGMSTYVGYTKDNIFSWFTDGYTNYIPRELASKFFFEQGNTIGILLLMILPIIYHLLYTSNKKALYGITIIIQSLAMIMLSSRVSVYGAIIVPIVVTIIMLFTKYIIRNDNFKNHIIALPLVLVISMSALLPYTPMMMNQKLNSINDQAVKDDDYLLANGEKEIQELLNSDIKKNDIRLIKAFEKYGIEDNLASAIPVDYFNEWYPYTHDAYFWVDLLFNVDFYDRVNGRQLQQLFLDYKFSDIEERKLLGTGYSTLMTGSFIMEKDFVQQYNSFGLFGFILIVCPWLMVLCYGIFKILIRFKENMKSHIIIYAMSFVFGILGAYVSGHTLDQFITTTFMALLVGKLLNEINNNRIKEKNI